MHAAGCPALVHEATAGRAEESKGTNKTRTHTQTNATHPAAAELAAALLRQVEYYFSDANIVSDIFLMQKIQENEEGWGACARCIHFDFVAQTRAARA